VEHFHAINGDAADYIIVLASTFCRRVLLFPKGNNVDCLSIYLDVADAPCLPNGWTRYAHFSLAVLNQYDPKLTVKRGEQVIFSYSVLF
jgi:ubiquitin carboxyl-terminal hydrolase 7